MARFKQATSLIRFLVPRPYAVSTTVQRRSASLVSKRTEVTSSSQQLVKPEKDQHVQYSSLAQQPTCSIAAEKLSLDPSGTGCYITWEDGFQSYFHSVWLRHNCHCEECRHPNGQKLLDPTTVSCSLTIDRATISGDSLIVTWSGSNEVHRGLVPLSFLRAHNYNEETMLERRLAGKCKATSKIPSMKYEDITSSKEGITKWLQQINEDGLSLIKGVPQKEGMVHKVAEMIGPVMATIYGATFDVEVTQTPINVAYSSLGIDLHQDLVYFESPPGLQLLHCLEFDNCVEGGGSYFLDVFEAADEFRSTYPDLFDTLTRVPATFEKVHYDRETPVHIVNQKPHIKLNHLGDVVAVYWAPPFEGALSVAGDDVEKYYLAYEMFAKALKNSPKILRHRLCPGELVIFNNLRMLHAREEFHTRGGSRKLQGCYVNIDIFKSKTQVMNNVVGDGRLAKRVGNQCWF